MVVLVMIAGPWVMRQSFLRYGLGEDVFESTQFLVTYLGTGFLALTFGVMYPQQTTRARLYELPVSNGAITSWLMGSAVVVCFMGNLLIVSAYEWVFGVEWPILTTGLVITAGALAVQAAYWSLLEFRIWRLIVCLAAAVVAVVYVLARFAPDGVDQPAHGWSQLEWHEWCIWSATVVSAAALGFRAISRERCGEGGTNQEIDVDLGRSPSNSSELRVAFSSSVAAQTWFEWRRAKRVAMIVSWPVGILLLLLMLQLPEFGNPRLLEQTLVLLIVIPALAGLLLGIGMGEESLQKVKRRDSSWCALPMNNSHLASAALRANFKACCLMWGIVFCLGACAPLLAFLQIGPDRVAYDLARNWFTRELDWIGIPFAILISFVATWTVSALSASLMWTGRHKFVAYFNATVVTTIILAIMSVSLFVERVDQREVVNLILIGFGIVTVITAGVILARAQQMQLIERATRQRCLFGWMFVAIVICCLPFAFRDKLAWAPLAVLIVVPFAAAPLAFAWNRHR
jgi:hypothetical protein